jgi:hypothetical protein
LIRSVKGEFVKVKKVRYEAPHGSSTPVPIEYWEDDGQPEPEPQSLEITPEDTDLGEQEVEEIVREGDEDETEEESE